LLTGAASTGVPSPPLDASRAGVVGRLGCEPIQRSTGGIGGDAACRPIGWKRAESNRPGAWVL